MWIAAPLARSLTGRFVRSAAATALATAALVTVAALVEGHPPRIETLRALVAPLAGALGACWALGGWRRSGADVALAGLGWRGGGMMAGLLVLALPLMALGPRPALDADTPMTVSTDRIIARLPAGVVEWRWTAEGIERRTAGRVETMASMPAPDRSSGLPTGGGLLAALALRIAALALALLWLSRGGAPGPPRVVIAATLAFVCGHGAAWMVA